METEKEENVLSASTPSMQEVADKVQTKDELLKVL